MSGGKGMQSGINPDYGDNREKIVRLEKFGYTPPPPLPWHTNVWQYVPTITFFIVLALLLIGIVRLL